MNAQYRFSLIHVLGLLTLAVGVIVIVMACLVIANWMFGFGVFPLLNRAGAPLGITPDAALCFILCWVSLWVLRESTWKSTDGLAAGNVLSEANLRLASLIKEPNGDKALSEGFAPEAGRQDGQRSQDAEEKASGVEPSRQGCLRTQGGVLAQSGAVEGNWGRTG